MAACGSSEEGDTSETASAVVETTAGETVDEGGDDNAAPAETAAPAASASGDAACQVLQDELLEVDIVNSSGVVSGVFVVVDLGKSSGDRDEVTVQVKSMAPDERAIMPFEVIGAVPSDCAVLEVDAQQAGGFSTDEAADVTSCEVVDDNGLAVDLTLMNSGADAADYIMTAGLYDADGVRRFQMDVSQSDAPPGEAVMERSRVGFDYVDGLTCTVHEAFRRPER